MFLGHVHQEDPDHQDHVHVAGAEEVAVTRETVAERWSEIIKR